MTAAEAVTETGTEAATETTAKIDQNPKK